MLVETGLLKREMKLLINGGAGGFRDRGTKESRDHAFRFFVCRKTCVMALAIFF